MKSSDSSNPPLKIRLLRGDAIKDARRVTWSSIAGTAETGPVVLLPSEPQVELQHQPDGKDKIIVTCTCGKRVEITCETDSAPATQSQPVTGT